MTTIDNIMALADEYAGRSQLTEEGEKLARATLRAALTEALAAQPAHKEFQQTAMLELYEFQQLTECDSAEQYRTKLAAQPVRESLSDEHIERIYQRYGGCMINCTRAIERAREALEMAANAVHEIPRNGAWVTKVEAIAAIEELLAKEIK